MDRNYDNCHYYDHLANVEAKEIEIKEMEEKKMFDEENFVHRMNILTDVGGVTFTFDKEARKKDWLKSTASIIHSLYIQDRVNNID